MISNRFFNNVYSLAEGSSTGKFSTISCINYLTKKSQLYTTFTAATSCLPTISTSQIIQLQEGLILIKDGLSKEQQIAVSEIALKRGSEVGSGFWKIDELGNKVLNQAPRAPHRGRVFDALVNFPEIISQLGRTSLQQAALANSTIKNINATHVIMLHYQSLSQTPKGGYINWHQDKDPNDGDADMPVVSFALGDSCEFLVCNEKPNVRNYDFANPQNLAQRILFESGDVLIFGGASRYIHHAIYKIHKNTAPNYLPFRDARLNFTFRYAPKIIGKEEDFASPNFQSIYAQKN